jgi:adenylate kinase
VRLVLLGPPGAGKGTQAAVLADYFRVPHISTGDIFRANVKGDTELGREAKQYMDRGDYVPDDVVNRMVADRLAQADAEPGFVLDGYPRTVAQAEVLESLLEERARPLDAIVRFVVPQEELQTRLEHRAAQEGRADDTADAWRRRFEEYQEKTLPLEEFYRDRGLVKDVDAVGDVDEVTKRALAALGEAA